VTYSGSHAEQFWQIYIGLFDSPDFQSEPVATSEGFWPGNTDWGFNSFIDGFANGTYYVGAFLDVNENAAFDPLVDPAGAYGGVVSPTPLNVSNGSDFPDIVIPLQDPSAPPVLARSVVWPRSKHNLAAQRLFDLARERQIKP
jgi:hypothetical protein